MLTDSLCRYKRLWKHLKYEFDSGRYLVSMKWLSRCQGGSSSYLRRKTTVGRRPLVAASASCTVRRLLSVCTGCVLDLGGSLRVVIVDSFEEVRTSFLDRKPLSRSRTEVWLIFLGKGSSPSAEFSCILNESGSLSYRRFLRVEDGDAVSEVLLERCQELQPPRDGLLRDERGIDSKL